MKRLTVVFLRLRRIDPHLLAAITLAILAFAFKLFLLYKRRPYIDPDEGYYMVLARNILTGKGYALNGLPNIIFPPFLPACIAMTYILCHDLQSSLSLISAISGSALGVIVFFIARKKAPPTFALVGSLFVLFAYQMNAYIPVPSRYIDILYRGSDTLNCCLIFMALFFSMRFLETGKPVKAVGAGIFLALGYLTRPEGIILFPLVVLSSFLARTAVPIRDRVRGTLSMIIAFSVLAAPYVIYLKNVTGAWTLSGKVGAAQSCRNALLQVIDKNDWTQFRREHYSLNPETMQMNDTYFGYYRQAPRGIVLGHAGLIKSALTNLKQYAVVAKTLFPSYLLVFGLIGIFYSTPNIFKRDNSVDLLLISLVPFSLAVESLSYPIPRHHLFLVPFACLYAVIGMNALLSNLPLAKRRAKKLYGATILAICIISLGYEYFKNLDRSYISIPLLSKAMSVDVEVGRLLKAKSPETVMSEQPSFAVRAFSDWQVLPNAQLPQALAFGVHKKVDLVVIKDQITPYYRIIDLKRSKLSIGPSVNYSYKLLEKSPCYEWLEVLSED